MSDRERLVEVMARAMCRDDPNRGCRHRGVDMCSSQCHGTTDNMEISGKFSRCEAALTAAERAGFEFRMKENGDG